MKHEIVLDVNGETWPLAVESSDVLLDVLRMRTGVKSPKVGCERGDCGACTVLLDGRSVRSCLVLAVEVDRQAITTVEGLGEQLTPVQQAFIDTNAFQCGFCAPGIVMAAAELLATNADPTRADIQEALGGNLCRCTGYEPVIDAVLAAARKDSA